MKRLLFALAALLVAAPATADVATIIMDANQVGAVSFGGRALALVDLVVPTGMDATNFLSATLEVGATSQGAEGGLAELAIARWVDGGPVLPAGKESYVGALFATEPEANVSFDLTPIIEDLLAGQESSLSLAIGTFAESSLGAGSAMPIGADAWAIVTLSWRGSAGE